MLNDIVMNPVAAHQNAPEDVTEKTWIVGKAVIMVPAATMTNGDQPQRLTAEYDNQPQR